MQNKRFFFFLLFLLTKIKQAERVSSFKQKCFSLSRLEVGSIVSAVIVVLNQEEKIPDAPEDGARLEVPGE